MERRTSAVTGCRLRCWFRGIFSLALKMYNLIFIVKNVVKMRKFQRKSDKFYKARRPSKVEFVRLKFKFLRVMILSGTQVSSDSRGTISDDSILLEDTRPSESDESDNRTRPSAQQWTQLNSCIFRHTPETQAFDRSPHFVHPSHRGHERTSACADTCSPAPRVRHFWHRCTRGS